MRRRPPHSRRWPRRRSGGRPDGEVDRAVGSRDRPLHEDDVVDVAAALPRELRPGAVTAVLSSSTRRSSTRPANCQGRSSAGRTCAIPLVAF
jgi:hypothetical protein